MFENRLDAVKVIVLLASTLILCVVFVFFGIEGLLFQLDRLLMDAIVYYLASIAALIGIIWCYVRSRQLIRAMPFEE